MSAAGEPPSSAPLVKCSDELGARLYLVHVDELDRGSARARW